MRRYRCATVLQTALVNPLAQLWGPGPDSETMKQLNSPPRGVASTRPAVSCPASGHAGSQINTDLTTLQAHNLTDPQPYISHNPTCLLCRTCASAARCLFLPGTLPRLPPSRAHLPKSVIFNLGTVLGTTFTGVLGTPFVPLALSLPLRWLFSGKAGA